MSSPGYADGITINSMTTYCFIPENITRLFWPIIAPLIIGTANNIQYGKNIYDFKSKKKYCVNSSISVRISGELRIFSGNMSKVMQLKT